MENIKESITFSPELQLSHLVRIESMLHVSINMQAQIIANLEKRKFDEVIDKAWENVDQKSKELVQLLKDKN